MSQAGNVFPKIVLDAGRLTELEASFSPNFDGETLLEAPRKLIQEENYKDHLGFMVLELTTHGAEFKALTHNAARARILELWRW